LDVFSEEEIISDGYNIKPLFDGVGGEVDSRLVVKGEDNIDIGCGNAFGGNQEDGEE
jgi:hypothetical protein